MLWTFRRRDDQTSYEVCRAGDGSGFELKRRHDDGREDSETFLTLEQLNQRRFTLEQQLLNDGWSLVGR